MNNNGYTAKPELVINNLVQENSRLTHENAMLKAVLQEITESTEENNVPNVQQEVSAN